MDRLHKISEKFPMQIIYSGKAHPKDHEGKVAIQNIRNSIDEINKKNGNGKLRAGYIIGYDPEISLRLLSGADVWLNNPRRTREASGTSWMKASLNGCINLSTEDGSICEANEIYPETIYIIGPKGTSNFEDPNPHQEDEIDSNSLYERLEQIGEEYYAGEKDGPSEAWEKRRAKAPKLISEYNTHRLVKDKIKNVWEI